MHRSTGIAALLMMSASFVAGSVRADNLDHPTVTGAALVAGTPIESTLTKSVGFKQYAYTASKDGFVKLELMTKIVHVSDNGGKAWRPYLRVLRPDGTAEAWSSNGNQVDPNLGHATMIFRVKKGDRLDVIASIALNNDKHGPAGDASFTLTAKESL